MRQVCLPFVWLARLLPAVCPLACAQRGHASRSCCLPDPGFSCPCCPAAGPRSTLAAGCRCVQGFILAGRSLCAHSLCEAPKCVPWLGQALPPVNGRPSLSRPLCTPACRRGAAAARSSWQPRRGPSGSGGCTRPELQCMCTAWSGADGRQTNKQSSGSPCACCIALKAWVTGC